MNVYHVEWLKWTGTNSADKYESQTSDILASDRYILDGNEERDNTNTFVLKTQSAGKFWAVKFYTNRTHECWSLTEEQAVNMWADFESCSKTADAPCPDIKPFLTAFPGYTITDV